MTISNSNYMKPGDPTGVNTVVGDAIMTGDLVAWKEGDKAIEKLTANNGAYFMGVAEGDNPMTGGVTFDDSTVPGKVNVRRSGVFKFKTTAQETYTHGLLVKMGADCQTIALFTQASENPNLIVGTIFLPEATASVVGAAGVEIEVEIIPNYPVNNAFAAAEVRIALIS